MKITQLRQFLLSGGSASSVLIFGDDAYLRRSAQQQLTVSIVGAASSADTHCFTGSTPMDDILLAANSFSLMGGKMLVVADGFVPPSIRPQKDKQYEQDKGVFERDRKLLKKYVCAPNTQSLLLFVCESDSLTFFPLEMLRVDCQKLDKSTLRNWIITSGKREDVEFLPDAAERIAEYCLHDMSRISGETKKLISCGKKQITAAIVAETVFKDIEVALYDLTDMIGARNAKGAVESLEYLLERGEDEFKLLSMLYGYYRRMYYAANTNLSDAEMAAALGVKDTSIPFARNNAKKYSEKRLARALEIIQDADEKMKTFISPADVLKNTVLYLLNL